MTDMSSYVSYSCPNELLVMLHVRKTPWSAM